MTRHTEPPAWSAAIATLGVSFQKMQVTIDDQALTIEEKDGLIAYQALDLDNAHAREIRLLAERETLRARIRELTDRLDGTGAAAAECEDWVAI